MSMPDLDPGHVHYPFKATIETHLKECALRRSLECPVAIDCEHGNEFCEICDACTCEEIENKK